VTTPASPAVDRIICGFPASEDFRSVGRLLIGGVASRFDLPVDRVDDLLLAVESLFLQEASTVTMNLELEASPSQLLVRVGPFARGQIADPATARVLTPLVDEVSERYGADGTWVGLLVRTNHRSAGAG
jgi:hypothetical protein